MDVLAAILRIFIPLIRHFLSHDRSILPSGDVADSMGQEVSSSREAHQEGLCVSLTGQLSCHERADIGADSVQNQDCADCNLDRRGYWSLESVAQDYHPQSLQ